METDRTVAVLPRLFALAAIVLAGYMTAAHTGVVDTDQAGIRLELPTQLGPWQGHELLFCSSRNCGHSFFVENLPLDPDGTPSDVCPDCGAPLATMNWAEQSMLPKDTGLTRSVYVPNPPPGPTFYATIVLSGDDRSSIHRPQVCMVAQGHDIQDEYTIAVDMGEGRPPLDVHVLEFARPVEGQPDKIETTYYAYWFVGKGRTTASHVQRMIWMATDRIFHGVNHRWAYVSIFGARIPGSRAHVQTIADIASRLHPAILLPDDPPLAEVPPVNPSE